MKKIIFICLLVLSAYASNGQVVDAKTVKVADSLRLKTDWITSILKDTSLVGASAKNLPTADAVVKYIANRLKYDVKYGDTAALVAGYVRINRMLDSLAAVQIRIQSKLTKSDADTYYPAIQRLLDSMTAVQSRVQTKLTKSDADTYYPAIQRLLDSMTAVQSRVQTKQPLIGYTPENVANKATDLSTLNNTLYPTTQAVANYTQSALTGVLKDMGNYDASGNVFPSSGGSGTSGAIKKGDMWYISVAGTLGGTSVAIGAWIRALVDAPGQTAGNWAIASGSFGFTPANSARTLTVNGTTYDLTANRTWSVGTVTSVGVSVPTGLSVTSGSPVTSSGTIAIGLQSGYSIPTTSDQTNWNTAYNKRPSSASISTSTFTLTLGDGTTVTASIPTWNQNTTGSAATLTTARNIQGVSFNGSADINIINGTGFVKASGTTISYDNSTYLTTSSASSTYVAKAGDNMSGQLGVNNYTPSSDFGAGFSVAVAAGISGKGVNIGYNNSLDYGFIGAVHNGTAWKGLVLAPVGGAVYVGGNASANQVVTNNGTWSISITGNAVTWNSQSYTASQVSSPDLIMMHESGGTWKYSTASAVQTFLGLGSNAYTSTSYLPLAAGSGNRLTGDLYVGSNSYFRGRNSVNSADIAMMGVGGSSSSYPNHVFIDPDNNGSVFGGNVGIRAQKIVYYYSGGSNPGLRIGTYTHIWNLTNASTYMSSNMYYDNGWGISSNGYGLMSEMNYSSGVMSFYYSPTTTAGSTVTPTLMMKLDGSNNGDATFVRNITADNGGQIYTSGIINSNGLRLRGVVSNSPFSNSSWVQAPSGSGVFFTRDAADYFIGMKSDGSFYSTAGGSFGGTVTATGFIGYTSNYVDVAAAYGTFCGSSQHWIKIKADNGNYYYFLAYNSICPN